VRSLGNRFAGRKNAAAAHRPPNAARRHSGRRASSSACAAFYPTSIGLLRIVSETNARRTSSVGE
jgi:hypothetical protein